MVFPSRHLCQKLGVFCLADHDTGAKPQLAGSNRGTRPRWPEEIRPLAGEERKLVHVNDR